MTPISCEYEALILDAVRTDCWNDRLRAHLAECPACSETVLAAEILRGMREQDLAHAEVPEAGRVWWKAQLQLRLAAAERAAKPVTVAQLAALAATVVAFLAVCVWQWPRAYAWALSVMSSRQGSAAPTQSFVTSLWQTSSLLLVAGASALVFLSLLVAYLVRSEE